ncbi:DUF1905 domain-containing protein [Cohnella abietis]|uniref:DUF1905 domain-containing protein n=1 Tax=Cohnella abietis TaxID=2507935 RepID=A0A3T1D6Q3_9BACL|nr:YdeI/OmpD-associated family protein [Cohnella abietis]BBI33744.1 hypothetical protein KCTCHS21_31430 [Cohnella abietis]
MKIYRYKAEILKHDSMDAAYVTFPYSVEEEFSTKGQVKVKAIFDNTVEYRGSLANMGIGYHCLGITKKIRELIGKQPGDEISVEIQADNEPRIVDIPSDLEIQLQSHELTEVFSRLSYTKRKEYVEAVTSAKKPETRNNRITKVINDLK